jgi:hypothetical protein
MAEQAPNRLDTALERLEEVVRSGIEQPMRQLRQAIAERRKAGKLDEARLIKEIEEIASRERAHSRHFSAGEQLRYLYDRLMTHNF